MRKDRAKAGEPFQVGMRGGMKEREDQPTFPDMHSYTTLTHLASLEPATTDHSIPLICLLATDHKQGCARSGMVSRADGRSI